MRRRVVDPAFDRMPSALRAFDLDEWAPLVDREPPAGYAFDAALWRADEACRLWGAARREWAERNGGWPGGVIDELKGELAARRALRVERTAP